MHDIDDIVLFSLYVCGGQADTARIMRSIAYDAELNGGPEMSESEIVQSLERLAGSRQVMRSDGGWIISKEAQENIDSEMDELEAFIGGDH
jgi:hypothetical protein